MFKKVPESDIELLRQFDTPTVCNVIELLEIRPRTAGYMDGRIKAWFPELGPMVGYATTATFRASGPVHGRGDYAGLDGQVEAITQVPSPQVVVFQDLDDPPVAATFGEVMCMTYKAFGCVGLITSGAGRDILQVRELGFPVFASSLICSHGYCRIIDVNVPVHVGGLAICPGDLIHGDANGVTTIPIQYASIVARACKAFVEAEGAMLEYLRRGRADLDGYRTARSEMQRRIEELKARVHDELGQVEQ